jgi:hypothetical protein
VKRMLWAIAKCSEPATVLRSDLKTKIKQLWLCERSPLSAVNLDNYGNVVAADTDVFLGLESSEACFFQASIGVRSQLTGPMYCWYRPPHSARFTAFSRMFGPFMRGCMTQRSPDSKDPRSIPVADVVVKTLSSYARSLGTGVAGAPPIPKTRACCYYSALLAASDSPDIAPFPAAGWLHGQ